MVLISYKTNTVVLTFLSNFYPKKITYCLIYKQSNFYSLSLSLSKYLKWSQNILDGPRGVWGSTWVVTYVWVD